MGLNMLILLSNTCLILSGLRNLLHIESLFCLFPWHITLICDSITFYSTYWIIVLFVPLAYHIKISHWYMTIPISDSPVSLQMQDGYCAGNYDIQSIGSGTERLHPSVFFLSTMLLLLSLILHLFNWIHCSPNWRGYTLSTL